MLASCPLVLVVRLDALGQLLEERIRWHTNKRAPLALNVMIDDLRLQGPRLPILALGCLEDAIVHKA